MFPIAFTKVEIENTDLWKFFLTLLRESLQSVSKWKDDFVTIMSDQQKVCDIDNCFISNVIL